MPLEALNVTFVICEVPLGDFLSGRPPDVVELTDVVEKHSQRAHAEGLANDVGVEADIHVAAARGTFFVEPIELFPEDGEATLGVLALAHEDGEIVDLAGVGDGDDGFAATGMNKIRLVVIEQVAGEDQALLGDQVDGVGRAAQGR